MPNDYSYNLATNQKAKRELLVTAVNTAEFGTNYSSTPVWTVIGVGVEDSSIEFNPDTETKKDILGFTETSVNGVEMQQDFDPMTIRGGNPLQATLEKLMEEKDYTSLSLFEVLIIKAYKTKSVGGEIVYYAEKHSGCTIIPQSIGGGGHVDMPVNVHFSNDKTVGYVNTYKSRETITFTSEDAIRDADDMDIE